MTARADQATTRRYGMPWSGLFDAMDKHEAPLSAMGADSREMLCEPGRVQGLAKVKRRGGASGVGSANGVLEMPVADATMRGVEVFELPTSVSADGFPVLACMFADESKRYGQLYLRDGADYTELEEFGSTHYPTAASTQGNIKMPALPYDGNGATGYTRGAFEDARRRIVAGSRRSVGIKNRHYSPSFYSTPSNWDRSYNLSSGSGSNNHVRYPTGHIMPLWAPTFPAASYPARKATVAPWTEGDKFFAAVAFEWEDGTLSMPFIPRDINSTLTTGLGLVTVDDDADATVEYFDYIPWRDIPIGPPGVRRRWLMRSNKVGKAALTAGTAYLDIATLKLTAIIEDNVSTRYDDPRGNDSALVSHPLVRLDQVWAPRARYGAAFDSHHIIGYLRPGPCAIVIAPSAIPAGTSRGINAGYDDAALIGATAMLVQVRQDSAGAMTMRLRATAFGVAVPADTSIALGSGTSLQTLIDTINATSPASTGGEWVAQLAPGANANADVTNLAPTHLDIPNVTTTLNNAVIGGTDFSSLAEGMKVNSGLFAAGTYVKTKNSNTLVTMSAPANANSAAADMEFYADFGDDGLFTDGAAHSQYGNMRCYGNAYPGIIGFKQSYLDTFPTEKRDFMVTSAGPTQKPNAAHMFHTSPGGRYQAEADAGIYMGAAPLGRGCVVFYSNRIGFYSNQRSGGTGEDQDFRMEWIDFAHGCRSPYSIVHGNRWVGCWRDDGFWVYDGDSSAIITGGIFDPVTGKGLLTYEAGLCNAAASADTNDYYMHAHYRDGRLWINFRTDATHWANACYDCSPGIKASGLAQVLDPDGNPFGWSSRLRYSWRSLNAGCGGSIGSVRTSGGVNLYQSDDKNDKTNCGLMQEFETTGTWTDGADPVQWLLYTTSDMAGALRKFALSGLINILYRLTDSGAGSSITGTVYRNQQRTAVSSFTLSPTSGDTFTRRVITAPLASRSPGEVVEIGFAGGSEASQQAVEFSGIEIDAEVLDSLN